MGVYTCQHAGYSPESQPPGCVTKTGSLKVDNYVWNFVKRICSNPTLVKAAVEAKLNTLQNEHADLAQKVERFKHMLDEVVSERQWVITQARKGNITEEDMELQLGELRMQEMSHRKELDEYELLLMTQQQAETLAAWADRYLRDLKAGIEALEVKPEKLDIEAFHALHCELQAWRFNDKFPDDLMSQLKWAILEEKRRIVRTLIDRVIVGRADNPEGRQITPILAIEIPSAQVEFLVSGHQAPDYNPEGEG